MECPECSRRMYVSHKYPVLGRRYGKLPCYVRVYWCKSCQQRFRYVELRESLLTDLQAQFEEKRQSWIRTKAELEEKIRWLKMPVNSGQRRIQRIRQALIDLLDETF